MQLKLQHEHTKKKSISINDQSSKEVQNSKSSIQTGIWDVKSDEIQIQAKKSIKNEQKYMHKQNQKPKKQIQDSKKEQRKEVKSQKQLNVEIIKKQPQVQSVVSGEVGYKKAKKAKKKKEKKSQQLEQLSPEQEHAAKTTELYSSFVSRHNIQLKVAQPQFMHILRESFSSFALDQIDRYKQSVQMEEDPRAALERAKWSSTFLLDQLRKRKRIHEDRIYFGVLEQNEAFSDLIWRQEIQSQAGKQEVAQLFGDIHFFVMNDVWEGHYQIRAKQKASKDQIMMGSYKANQIRMAQGIIKQKLSALNEESSVDVLGQQERLSSHRKFDLKSQQTKKAEQFVRKLQQEQKLAKQRAKKLKQLQEEQEMRELQEQRQLQRHRQEFQLQQRRLRLQHQAEQRQRQKRHREHQQGKYLAFLSQHRQKTPLYMKKEQDFKAVLVKEQLRKLELMREVQRSKRSISKDQIQLHQIKYKQLKQLLQQERKQAYKVEQQQAQDCQMSYYRGKFYHSVAGEIDFKTTLDQKKTKAEQLQTKRIQYATLIKDKFGPKIDQKKKHELQKLIDGLAPKIKDDKQIALKTKMEGQKNLQKLHLLIGQLRAKGKIRKDQTPPADMFQSIGSTKSRYTNYLNDLRTSRMKNSSPMRKSRFNSVQISKLDINSVGTFQIQARRLEQIADRKSLFLKNSKNMDIQEYLQKKFELQEDYIQSAKAKLQIMNKYKMDH